MCGRFVGFRKLEEIRQYFPIDDACCEVSANFNVAPSQKILAIARIDGANVLGQYHWGLVPAWAKDRSMGQKMINARSETVAEKPSFRDAFKKRRCLIPADGFYEWVKIKGQKQPMFITRPDGQPFVFAGLWERWQERKGVEEIYYSCTIITRAAEGPMAKIHHRMPVILAKGAFTSWLDERNQDKAGLLSLMQTHAVTDLVARPVSRQVNTVANNGPSNIQPIQMEFDF